MSSFNNEKRKLKKSLQYIQKKAISSGLEQGVLYQFNSICSFKKRESSSIRNKKVLVLLFAFVVLLLVTRIEVENILSARCLLTSHYIVWEATRPLADCNYCANITKPTILSNVTRKSFAAYTYSSQPIIVKRAINHWRAMKELSYYTFKKLYEKTAGSYESLEDGCQFLNFKSDLFTLKDVFNMPSERVRNEPGQDPWYVGWGNCHPEILSKVRQYYSIPEFLPEDAEFPATENIFFGYEIGAVMHLDYIPRLMWQGQVKGNKSWSIAPVPECEDVCHKFEFYVEPGDIVLLDTRLWYHSTTIPKGQFSLTVQSEYG